MFKQIQPHSLTFLLLHRVLALSTIIAMTSSPTKKDFGMDTISDVLGKCPAEPTVSESHTPAQPTH